MLLAVLLALPIGASAQSETLTVAAGTATSTEVPVNGVFYDAAQHVQIIYSEAMLEEMEGSVISKLTFYLNAEHSGTWQGNPYVLKLGSYSSSTFATSSYSTDELTEVWSGELTVNANNELVFDFAEEYVYEGGNLLVDITSSNFFNQLTGAFGNGDFVGMQQSGIVSLCGYTTNSNPITPNTSNFLPKASFDYTLTSGDLCFRPRNLQVSAITSDGCTVSWTDTLNTGAAYTVAAVFADDTLLEEGATSPFTLSGLGANTPYTILVQAECSDVSHSGWTSTDIRTGCATQMSLPYFTDFTDDWEANVFIPFCWTQLIASYYNNGSTVYTQPLVWANNGPDNSNALGFVQDNMTDTGMICTSEFPAGVDCHISMWLRAQSGTMQVGFISDTSDLSTFNVVLTVNSAVNNQYAEYDLYTDDYELPDGSRLAFKVEGTARAFIDNLLVTASNGCHRPLSSEVVQSSIDYNTATVSWADPSAAAWEVRYSTVANDTLPSSATAVTLEADETSAVLTDLLPYTNYYVWVRSVCDNGTSDWRAVGTFQTARSCYAVSSLAVSNITGSSAVATWEYSGNGRGLEETGVVVTLADLTTQTDSTFTATGSYAFLTGLQPAHNYSLSVSTVCDPDTTDAATTNFAVGTCGETESGNYGSNSYPINAYYNYSYSQTIYPSTVTSGMDSIRGIAFHHEGSNTATRTISVHVSGTSLSTLPSAQAVTMATRVVSARSVNLNNPEGGWDTILFDSPIANPGNNLLVTILDSTGSYINNYPSFYYHNSGTTYYYSSDGSCVNVTNPGASSPSSISSQADMRFIGECAAACPRPNVAVSANTEAGVEVTWIAAGDESSWTVEYRADTDGEWTVAEESTSDNTLLIADLNPSTLYHFRVGYTCDDALTYSPSASVYTLCAPLASLPLTETFEGMPTNRDPLCWQVIDQSTEYGSHYVTAYGHESSQSVRLYPYGVQYLVSPLIPTDEPNALEINFWASLSNYGSHYDVGLMTDPADPATFRMIFSTTGNGDTWTEYTLYTDSITLTASDPVYVAWRFYVNDGYNCYIDDVNIGTSSCKRPTSVAIASLASNTATLQWTGMEGASYEVALTATATAPDEGATLISESDTSHTFSELTSNTTYYFWVRTLCGETATAWSSTFSFRTLCSVESTPWTENFDAWTSLSECWLRYSGAFSTTPVLTPVDMGNTDVQHFQLSTPGGFQGYNPNGTKALVVDIWNSHEEWIMTPPLHVDAPLLLSFDLAMTQYNNSAYPSHNSSDRVLYVLASTDGGANWTVLSSWGTGSAFDHPYSELTNSSTGYAIPLNYSDVDLSIGFFVGSYSAGDDNNLYIDNISLFDAGCTRPATVSVSDIDTTSVTVNWTDLNDEIGTYSVALYSGSTQVDSVTVSDALTTTFSGLSASTAYTVSVRRLCDGEPTNARTTSFRTSCDVISVLPWTENFDTYGDLFTTYPSALSDDLPCWDFIGVTSSAHLSLTNNSYRYGQSGFSLLIYPGTANAANVLVLPPFSTEISQLQLSFQTRPEGTGSNPGSMDIGYVTNASDASSFVAVSHHDHSDFNDAYSLLTATFADAPAGSRMAIRHNTVTFNHYWFFDEFTVDVAGDIPTPPTPDPCDAPTAVNASANASSVTLAWNADGSDFEVAIVPGNSLTNPTAVADNSGSHVFTGLTPATVYTVGVRRVCAESNSDWVTRTVTTDEQVGISNFEIQNSEFELYPNPATSVVTVSVNNLEIQNSKLEIVSLNGQVLDQFEIHNSQFEIQNSKFKIDISSLPAGAYFVRLTGQQQTAVRKLIVK